MRSIHHAKACFLLAAPTARAACLGQVPPRDKYESGFCVMERCRGGQCSWPKYAAIYRSINPKLQSLLVEGEWRRLLEGAKLHKRLRKTKKLSRTLLVGARAAPDNGKRRDPYAFLLSALLGHRVAGRQLVGRATLADIRNASKRAKARTDDARQLQRAVARARGRTLQKIYSHLADGRHQQQFAQHVLKATSRASGELDTAALSFRRLLHGLGKLERKAPLTGARLSIACYADLARAEASIATAFAKMRAKLELEKQHWRSNLQAAAKFAAEQAAARKMEQKQSAHLRLVNAAQARCEEELTTAACTANQQLLEAERVGCVKACAEQLDKEAAGLADRVQNRLRWTSAKHSVAEARADLLEDFGERATALQRFACSAANNVVPKATMRRICSSARAARKQMSVAAVRSAVGAAAKRRPGEHKRSAAGRQATNRVYLQRCVTVFRRCAWQCRRSHCFVVTKCIQSCMRQNNERFSECKQEVGDKAILCRR